MRALRRLGGVIAPVLAFAARAVQAANTSVGQNGDTLSVPTQPPIVFFWSTFDDSLQTIPQCAGFQVSTSTSPTTAVQPVPPLYFTAAAIGYQPETQYVAGAVGGRFTWSANYPVGTKLLFAMTDSANNSGGAVGGYTIVPGSGNCTLANNTAPPMWYTSSPSDQPCDEIVLEINGGVKPYDISVLAPATGAYMNVTGVDQKSVNLKNVVPAGQTFNIFISDSNGTSTVVSDTQMSKLNQSSCQPAVPPSSGSSTSIGTIVGAVVGGVLGAVLVAALAWWFVRRRNKKRAEQYRQRPPAVTSEFRTADGGAPLVEPFRIPMGGATAGVDAGVAGDEMYEDNSPDSYDKSAYPFGHDQHGHYTDSAKTSTGGVAVAPPPHPYDSAGSTPYSQSYVAYDHPSFSTSSGAAAGHGHASYESSSATPRHGTEYLSPSAQGSYAPMPDDALRSGGIDGLAHPEEFEYRIAGESPTGTGTQPWAQPTTGAAFGLPPGARPY